MRESCAISMAAILLVMLLESCSKANTSADVIEEENNLYASFLMTMSLKFFTTEVQFNIVSSKKQFPAWLCAHVFICMCVNVVCSKYSSLS